MTDPDAPTCGFCGRQADGVFIATWRPNPQSAICEKCLRSLHRSLDGAPSGRVYVSPDRDVYSCTWSDFDDLGTLENTSRSDVDDAVEWARARASWILVRLAAPRGVKRMFSAGSTRLKDEDGTDLPQWGDQIDG